VSKPNSDDLVSVSGPLARRFSELVSSRAVLTGTVYLLLDHSTSMVVKGKLTELTKGALRFFAEAYLRGYAVGAIGFGSTAHVVSGATRNFHLFQKRVVRLEAEGRTAMAAALRLASWRLRFRRGHRVIMLMTDGQPDSRERTLQAAKMVRAQGIELVIIATSGADSAFLAQLMGVAELDKVTTPEQLEETLADSARTLPERL
jgi:Ca-activated chloride channel homolog